MRVSLNTIKQYTQINISTDELVEKINRQLGGVEEVKDIGAQYVGATIVKVVSCEKHPNADKLNICMVDDGGVTTDVERDDNGLVRVVCGAPNVHADMMAVWLPPRTTVPSTYHSDPFVLGARELRGIVSNGMLASAKELALGDSHDGILEIDPDEWKPNDIEVKPGVPFAEVYGLNDTVIDIENKMFTHRPDLFGQLGVAREIAGIQHNEFVSPDWYKVFPEFSKSEDLLLNVLNDAQEKVPRFMAIAVKDVTIKPSPVWLQAELIRLGSKPINNIVDVTNYIMLLTGQPTHAYDYDRLAGNVLGARMAKQGETITLLNHKTYQLDESDVVIVDGDGPVGLAGIMGGGESEVSDDTTNIVLEVANFDMYTVRKSSMRHGVFTDALTRFNKGQSAYQNPYVLDLLMKSIFDVAGGTQASDVYDEGNGFNREHEDSFHTETGTISAQFINMRLGTKLKESEIAQLLTNVEFHIEMSEAGINYRTPYWRTDIEQSEDIVEEVGRLYGFENLPKELPRRTISPTNLNQDLERNRQVRDALKLSGANEVLTYSFVHEKLMTRSGQDTSHAFRLSNALSPELQYYRLSLLPSLLDKVNMNVRAGYDKFALFEINKVHFKGEFDKNEPDVPNEDSHVGLVIAYADKTAPNGAPYYHARRYLERIVDLSSFTIMPLNQFDLESDEWGKQLTAPYAPNRSAVIVKDDQIWGVFGEFLPAVSKSFKLPKYAAGFEVHTDIVTPSSQGYKPLSKYPSVAQDVSIRASSDIPYETIIKTVQSCVNEHNEGFEIVITPTTIYKPEGDFTTTTFHLNVTSYDRTLTDNDVKPVTDALSNRVAEIFDGTIV